MAAIHQQESQRVKNNPQVSMESNMKINLQAPINQLGYGVAGLNILKALQKKAEVSLFPIGQPQVTNQADADAVVRGVDASQRFDPNAPCIKIWHQNQMAERIGSGKFIGFPIFELDTFTDVEKHHLQSCDELFVCSEWAKQVVLDQTNLTEEGVHVVPLGVDSSIFKETLPRTHKTTIFFNCGKWEVRKGHDVLVDCFNAAFDHSDDVELWMMCENPFYTEHQQKEWINLYKQSKLGDKIRIIPRQKTHQDVYNIMKQTDCGVFPARAEGWNLELLEMMACGKQVIATNYSAHTEFCNSSNSMLVEVNSLELANDGVWFKGNGMWASLDSDATEQIIFHMKSVHNQKRQGLLHQNIDGIQTSREFSWENSAKNFLCGLK